MKLFRYKADRWPVFVFAGLFAIDFAVYFNVDQWQFLLLWTLLGIIPKGCVCAYNHHHQHVPVFLKAWANRLLEVMYGMQTGIVGHGWVLHHTLGHHVNYLDQQKDESAWLTKSGRKMGEVEYTLNVAGTAYARCYKVGKRYPRQQRIFLSMCVVTFGLVGALAWYRPLPALFVFIIPMINALTLTSWATYGHHAGHSTDNHFVASVNTIHRVYNIVTGNLGYHTAHHYRQGIHWSKLPALHDEIKHLIPAKCYSPPGIPWRYMGECDHPEIPVETLPLGPEPLAARAA